jgi:3-isopropylmalate/(R)-2-methylmalate dehydratase large subunit
MGQTMAEKIMSRRNVAGAAVSAGDLIDANIDGLMVHISWPAVRAAYKKIGFEEGPPKVWDRDKFYLMMEHNQPPTNVNSANANLDARRDAERLALKYFYDAEMGICHQMMVDYGHTRPGELVVGTDSHTCMLGALNCVATGIGAEEAAYALAFGELFFTVPESIKIVLKGKARPYPFAKDIILYLAGQYGDAFAQNQSIEFLGPMATDMDLADRMCLADHAVEVGAKFGLFTADDTAKAFVRERTRVDFETVEPDPDAAYVREIEVDCDALGFQVAKPHRFDNVAPIDEVIGTRIDQARIGSCANGRFEDIAIAARMLKGRKVASHVRFYISPASMTVYKQCADAGLIGDLIEAGVHFQAPGCSICTSQVVLNEEVCITSTTRNSRGRFGGATTVESQAYLAGPATVAAAAIAGEIIDPREVLDA